MARETLLGPTHAPEDTVFSWNAGFGNPVECARRYGETVKKIMGGADDPPNLLLLGLGEDGHTASLFPDGVVHHLNGGESMVGRDLAGISAAVWVASLREWRMTLCPSFLVTARRIVFLVSGKGKRATLRRALNRDAAVPASWVVGGNTLFLATRDALGENDGD
jgi:6-phosphogluconolactonase